MICKHCKDQLTVDRGVLVDSTGGDVCGIASVADENPPNENMPHEVEDPKMHRASGANEQPLWKEALSLALGIVILAAIYILMAAFTPNVPSGVDNKGAADSPEDSGYSVPVR